MGKNYTHASYNLAASEEPLFLKKKKKKKLHLNIVEGSHINSIRKD